MKKTLFLVVLYFLSVNAYCQYDYDYGYINGSGVTLRSDHSTTASKIRTLKRGEDVDILDEFAPTNNSNQAILKQKTTFYNASNKQFAFELPVGKAVKVINHLSGDKVKIRYVERDGSVGEATITKNLLKFINGDTWYKVRTSDGKVGWVYGEYVIIGPGGC